ncbi:MAG: methyltransferase [Nanopusillaceae archaeon]
MFIKISNLKIYYKIKDLECYPPLEDSLLLNKYIPKFCKNKKVLDLGCGTGIQGLEAYKYTKKVTFSDIDNACIKLAKINFYLNYINPQEDLEKIYNIVESFNFPVKFILSDLFEKIDEKFDVILFNPPYLPETDKEEENIKRWICGGKNGKEIIERFLNNLENHLDKNGISLVIMSSFNDPKKIFNDFSDKYKFTLIEKIDFFLESLYLVKISKLD